MSSGKRKISHAETAGADPVFYGHIVHVWGESKQDERRIVHIMDVKNKIRKIPCIHLRIVV